MTISLWRVVQEGKPRLRHHWLDPIGPRVSLFQPRTFQPDASSPRRQDHFLASPPVQVKSPPGAIVLPSFGVGFASGVNSRLRGSGKEEVQFTIPVGAPSSALSSVLPIFHSRLSFRCPVKSSRASSPLHRPPSEKIDYIRGCPDIVLAPKRQRRVVIRSSHVVHTAANGEGI
jgi:hypothetical protein